MRVLVAALILAALSATTAAGDTAGAWLDRAANPTLSRREREYAAQQALMLADSSASILISALKQGDSASALRRQTAAWLLGELPPDKAEAPLVTAALGEDPFLADAAAVALARMYSRMGDGLLRSRLKRGGAPNAAAPAPPDGEDWLHLALEAANARGRFRALVMRGLALKYAAPDARLPAPMAECIWEGLTDANRDLRMHAAALAAKTGDTLAPEKLAALLYSETDVRVLVAALGSMAAMRPPVFGEAVERHTAHADPLVALEALAALDAMGYQNAMFPTGPGARAIAHYVVHPSTRARRRAVELLAGSRNPAAIEYLATALFDRVGANRAAAARALGELGFAAAVGSLTPLLRDGRPEVRAEAALALDRLGVLGVAAGVLDDLAGESLPFRRAAAETLGKLGDARAVPALLRTLDDPDAELVCLAAEALGSLRQREAGPKLFAAMTASSDDVVRDAARKALTAVYGDDPGASSAHWESWRKRNRLMPEERP